MRITIAILAQATCLALISVICPQITAADTPAGQAFVDVKLHEGGKLLGRIVDQQGRPIADTDVELKQTSGVVASAKTKKDGWFEVRGLRGGKYLLTANSQSGLVRAWTAQTAPPAATEVVQLVTGDQAVLGQGFDGGNTAFRVIAGVGLVVGILSINRPNPEPPGPSS